MKSVLKKYDRCCNPYNVQGHRKNNLKELRPVTLALKSLHRTLSLNQLICGSCRLKIKNDCENKKVQDTQLKNDEVSVANTKFHSGESSKTGPATIRSPEFAPKSSQEFAPKSIQEFVATSSQEFVATSSQQSDCVLTGESISSLSLTENSAPSKSDLADTDVAIQQINGVLNSLNLPSLKKISSLTDSYILSVVNDVHQTLIRKFDVVRPSNITSNPGDVSLNMNITSVQDGWEVLSQLKQLFCSPQIEYRQKIMILTLAPLNWSARKIEKFFECSFHMAHQAKILVQEKGLMTTQGVSSKGHKIPVETVNLVRCFYTSDEISRLLPGKKDFVSIRDPVSNARIHEQKRLVLGNLKEIYEAFKEENSSIKIGFSKFAELRPKQCVLAGSSGTHTTCVCTFHQNVKLIFQNCSMSELTKDSTTKLSNFSDCIALMVCEDPNANCYFSQCSDCPGITKIKEILQESFDQSEMEEISFKQWVSTDRTKLLTITLPIDEFIEEMCRQLKGLLCHDFIAKKQSSHLTNLKNQLNDGEFLVICDFAQNYAFVAQDAAQGFYWNNEQATLHPFVIYYRNEGKLEHQSICVISDCLKHDSTAVYLFQNVLLKYLKDNFTVKKIFYYSDGAPQQYKNRNNFVNLYYHFDDFNVAAEWNFFATAHGKGACDGLAGTVKRLASRASLQLSASNQILNPRALYEWCKANILNIEFFYRMQSDYDDTAKFLAPRFSEACRVPQTQQMHCVIPRSGEKRVITKRYSACAVGTTCKIIK